MFLVCLFLVTQAARAASSFGRMNGRIGSAEWWSDLGLERKPWGTSASVRGKSGPTNRLPPPPLKPLHRQVNEGKALYAKLKVASSYEEWQGVAERLDELEGAREWKRDPSSPFYDSNLIQQRVDKFRELIDKGDIQTMMFRLRVGLNRNLGGIGAPELFDRTHVGTKELIEEHREQLITMFCAVRDAPEETISLDKRVAFFSEARHAFGKTALVLSGGASLGMYHMGVVKALLEQGLLPRIISGSNAGAIVASWCCTRTSDELVSVFAGGARSVAEAMSGNLGFNPVGSLERKLRRALQTGHLMDVQKLKNALQKHIGDVTFHEAYERTGRILNITVSPGSDYEKPRLLNYLTAPTVLIWSAASASCALPGLYEAVELLSKTPKGDHVPYQVKHHPPRTRPLRKPIFLRICVFCTTPKAFCPCVSSLSPSLPPSLTHSLTHSLSTSLSLPLSLDSRLMNWGSIYVSRE